MVKLKLMKESRELGTEFDYSTSSYAILHIVF